MYLREDTTLAKIAAEFGITDPGGRLLWLSPALPGRAHGLTAAVTHQIIRIWERQGVSILADLAYRAAAPG